MKGFTLKVAAPFSAFHVITTIHSKVDIGDPMMVSEAENKTCVRGGIRAYKFIVFPIRSEMATFACQHIPVKGCVCWTKF